MAQKKFREGIERNVTPASGATGYYLTLASTAGGAGGSTTVTSSPVTIIVRHQSLSLTAGGTRVAVEATGLATGLYWVYEQSGGETAVTRLSLE